ncbi:MAG: hypothetical protein QOI89_3464, partial [Solirubrobacteraceae bacterium]|nr:hypothetical protein [Solirubrobacteraceae bacterium]
ATLHYVYWFNHHRLLEINGDLPPIELEQAHYRRHNSDLAEAGMTQNTESPETPGGFRMTVPGDP